MRDRTDIFDLYLYRRSLLDCLVSIDWYFSCLIEIIFVLKFIVSFYLFYGLTVQSINLRFFSRLVSHLINTDNTSIICGHICISW